MKDYTGIDELKCLEETLSNWHESKAKEVIKLIEGKKILDVGCGIGTFTKSFVKSGFDVTGIDSSQDCLSQAKNINAKFLKEDITKIDKLHKYKNYFDSIVSLDVLEHIENEENALSNMKYLLKDSGVLVLTVPAFSFLYSALDAKAGHKRRYTVHKLKKLLTSNGFKIEKIFYWNLPGFFGWSFCKIIKKNPTKILNKDINYLYKLWFKIEEKIRFPLGLTLFVKARKM